ncbi:MAG: YihY/virulence factor BrkB family protein [Candidatus Rokuibacteriota bacterium]
MAGLLRAIGRAFLAHDGFFLAAGLSFYVVICVVPFVLLLIAGGGFLLADEMVVREVLDQLSAILPVYQAEMEEILTGVVRGRGLSGFLGTVILLLFATQLFAATRLVLNRIFGTRGRGFFHGVAFDIAMILLLTLLFFVAIGISAASAWAQSALTRAGREPLLVELFQWVGLFVAVALNTVLFVMVYRLVPLRRIAWPSVLAGSVTAAVLWELAKQLFRLYIEGIGVYSTLYGALGVTIALIMWVYYSAIVFVLGAELIRALEERRGAV